MKNYIYFLNEDEYPTYFYNIIPDIEKHLKTSVPAPLHPGTKQELGEKELSGIFSEESVKQEFSKKEKIDIPEEIREIYSTYRPTPLIRAKKLEEALDTPAKIYFKNEGATLSGSHKINTALMQAYNAKKEGLKGLTTETGAGQWGTALSMACKFFGLDCNIFMVRSSYDGKPYRKEIMRLFEGHVMPSPSIYTESGKKILNRDPDSPGSLGIAISEAIEYLSRNKKTKYSLGSVLNHVLLHQTIIGLEAKKQMEKAGDYPDIVIGCVGGGSNFAGIAYPYIKDKFEGKKIRFIASEPDACPTLTKGVYDYDFGDTTQLTPLLKMHTLGSSFIPDPIHAGGLRYHGMAPSISVLKDKNIIEAKAYNQKDIFNAAKLFAETLGIVPAPESAHAIKTAIDEAVKAKEEGKKKVILFNLSGHGNFDMQAYSDFLDGKLK